MIRLSPKDRYLFFTHILAGRLSGNKFHDVLMGLRLGSGSPEINRFLPKIEEAHIQNCLDFDCAVQMVMDLPAPYQEVLRAFTQTYNDNLLEGLVQFAKMEHWLATLAKKQAENRKEVEAFADALKLVAALKLFRFNTLEPPVEMFSRFEFSPNFSGYFERLQNLEVSNGGYTVLPWDKLAEILPGTNNVFLAVGSPLWWATTYFQSPYLPTPAVEASAQLHIDFAVENFKYSIG